MAFLKAITTASGIVLNDAYHKIDTIKIRRVDNANIVSFVMSVFASQSARVSGLDPVNNFGVTSEDENFFSYDAMNVLNVNIFSLCYNYLKTQNNINGIDYTTATEI